MTNIRGQKAKDYLRSLSNDLRTKEGKRKQILLSKISWHTWGWEWEDCYSYNTLCHKRNKKFENAVKYLITKNIKPRKDGCFQLKEIKKVYPKINLSNDDCYYLPTTICKVIGKQKQIEKKYNQTKEIGYKVVRIKNSKTFKPATELALQKIEYRIGKETTRFGNEKAFGGFAVFENLERAKKWLENYGEKILKVEYIKSNDTLWKKNPPSYCKGYNGYFAQSNGVSYFEGNYPEGTVVADYVKPLELVL